MRLLRRDDEIECADLHAVPFEKSPAESSAMKVAKG
jgi:hypothetical protein